jgi:hypothetical protein
VIARLMAEPIVQLLDAIEVERDDAVRAVMPVRRGVQQVELLLHEEAVVQAGQRVPDGQRESEVLLAPQPIASASQIVGEDGGRKERRRPRELVPDEGQAFFLSERDVVGERHDGCDQRTHEAVGAARPPTGDDDGDQVEERRAVFRAGGPGHERDGQQGQDAAERDRELGPLHERKGADQASAGPSANGGTW